MRFGERICTLLRISILSYQDYKNIISSLWGDFIFWVKSPLTNVLLMRLLGKMRRTASREDESAAAPAQ